MIELKTLYLDGWLSYDKEEIDLSQDGITRICGESGSGKSAIFEAILYLLFGDILRKKTSVKDLSNKIIDKGYDISIELCVDGVPVKIKETRDREEDDLYFYINEKDKRGKTKVETRKSIVKYLGMSFDEFKSIAYLGQRDNQILITGTNSERGRLITSIFGLEKYDLFIKNCDDDVKQICRSREALSKKFMEYKEEHKNLCETLQESTNAEDAAKDEEKLSKLTSKIENFEQKLSTLRKMEGQFMEILGKHSAIKKQKENRVKLEAEIRKLEEDLKNKRVEGTEKDFLEEEIGLLKDQRATYKAKISNLKSELNSLITSDVCPINNEKCPVDVPGTFRCEREEKCKVGLSKNLERLAKAEEELKIKEKDLTKINEYERAKVYYDSKNKSLKSLDSMEEPEENEQEVLEELERCRGYIKEGETKIKVVRSEKEEVSSAILTRKKIEESRKRMNKLLKDKEKIINDSEEELIKLNEDLEYSSAALHVFKKAKIYKIDLVIELLNSNLKEILSKISSGYDAKIVSERMDSTGKKALDCLDILTYNGSVWLPIGMLSGGQENVVGISVLLAIWKTAQMLSNKSVNMLILDEIFGPLSDEIVDEVFQAIIDISMDIGATSIKFVSHRDVDTRFVDFTWNVSRYNGLSKLEAM